MESKQKIVHIGYHKTGTTFLQNVLFPEHPEIFYVNRPITQRLFLRIGSLFFDVEKTKKEINRLLEQLDPNQKALVFSDEELSGNIHTGGNGGYLSKEVADRIYKTMPDAHIVITVRNQVSMIDSVYKQYVKKGGTFGLKKYLYDNGGANHRFPQFSFTHFEYDQLINYYIKLFGPDNVHVFIYEKARKDREYYNNMLEELGLSRLEDLNKLVDKQENPSYSTISLRIARIFNHFYGKDPINKKGIMNLPLLYKGMKKILYKFELSNIINSKKSSLDKSTEQYIKEYYKESNRNLEAIVGDDLSKFNYPK
ncbi:hypothetical protein [Thalassobacillus sp. CUG 92003]|uniref:hypothetical protein n=1 Tax=Thalassobacillus sp. CUG 92003 TaxID=2736641 RepID=UPI0015E7B730|nr:hypothetical protein [Thalassobacillus sp. CUG 92003]